MEMNTTTNDFNLQNDKKEYVLFLDPPVTPTSPAKSKNKFIVFLAGILGIVLSMLFAFIKEYVDNSDEEVQAKMSKVKSLILKNITDFLPKRFLKI